MTIRVAIPGSVWDEVVDSIAADAARMVPTVDLSRRSGEWAYERHGFGGRYVAWVPRGVAEQIAGYLRSRLGLSTYYDEGRSEARASEAAGIRAARAIEAQLREGVAT